MKKISKKAVIGIIIAAAAAAAVFLIFMFMTRKDFYESHFFHGTYINGWDVSDLTAEEVKNDIQSDVESYELTLVKEDGTSDVISGKDLGFTYTDDGEIDKLLEEQDGSEWFSHISTTDDYSVNIEFGYDESKIEAVVGALDIFAADKVTKSENAYLNLTDNGFEIVPEVVGNEVNKEALCMAVKDAVENDVESINLADSGLYIKPTVTSQDQALIDSMNSCNKVISAQITYDFKDRQWVVDKDELISWLVQGEDGTYSIDRNKVYEWVASMAYDTDTFGLSHKFMTSYGVEVTLEPGGDYGWCIDKDATTDNLYNYILEGTVATVEPNYLFTAMDRSSNDIGGTYVEICISTQTMWLYVDGKQVLSTPVITGNVAKGYATPSGSVWAIDAKKTDWKFTTFANAYSDYWMPFNGDVGIHDASWQPANSYVVDTYLTAGSHGCVNTPLDAVRTIYENVEIGTPVIVYYKTDQVHGHDNTEILQAG